MPKGIVLFAAILLAWLKPSAQEQVGWRLDGFAGVNALTFNPALLALSPLPWDLNLLEGAQFAANNYAFLERNRITPILFSPTRFRYRARPGLSSERPLPADVVVIDFHADGRRRFAYNHTALMGPSFFLRLGERHQIGAFSRLRAIADARQIDTDLSYYDYRRYRFFQTFQVDPTQSNVLMMAETGLHYSLSFQTNGGVAALGLNARYLLGYEGASAVNRRPFELTKLPDSLLQGSPITFEYAYTTSALDGRITPQVNGRGFGFDVGLVFSDAGPGEAYRWRVGTSLLDIGRLSFRRNAKRHFTQTEETRIIPLEAYSDFRGLADLEPKVALFSQHALDDPEASFAGDNFQIWLPTAISIFGDWALSDKLFLSGAWVQGTPLGAQASGRGSLLTITPRMQRRWWSLAAPLSLYRWQQARLGLHARLGFLTLGTDDMLNYLYRPRINSVDFYFAVKFSPFWNANSSSNDGGKRRAGKGGQRKRDNTGCYRF
jgi:hypothetical protein